MCSAVACRALPPNGAAAPTRPPLTHVWSSRARVREQGTGRLVAAPTTLAAIIGQEGIGAIFVGVAPRVLRRSMQQAITWWLYETVLATYRKQHGKQSSRK